MLGSNAPPLTVKLERASSSGSKDGSLIESQVVFYFALCVCVCARAFHLYFSHLVPTICYGELLLAECFPICVIQELKFDKESSSHFLELPKNVDVGKYTFDFEVSLSAHLFV